MQNLVMFSSKNRSGIILFFIPLFLLLTQVLIRVDQFYISDPLIKWIQVVSLWEQNWTTESILYPARHLDPLFLMSPLNENFVFLNQDRLIGQYPIGFTFVYSLLGVIPHHFLPYLNFLFLALFIHLMRKNNFAIPVIVFAILGTVIFPLLIDFSENGLFILLSAYGYYFLFQAFQTNQTKEWILGNLFLGLSLWLRLEGILLFVSIQMALFYLQVVKRKESFLKILHPIRYIVFAIVLFVFFIWNYKSYTDPLGTRHLANFGKFEKTIFDQIQIFISIIFTFPKKEMWTLGFFLQSPIYLYTLFKLKKENLQSNPTLLFHILVIFHFLVFVAITSPNDGLTLNGRYLSILVFPLTFLLNEMYSKIQNQKLAFYSLGIWTFFCNLLILIVFYFSGKELKKLKSELSNFQSDLIVTTSEVISGGYTIDLISKKVICVRKDSIVSYFYSNLMQSKTPEFLLLYVKKNRMESEDEKDSYQAILREAKANGYTCSPSVDTSKIMSQKCIRTDF